LRASSTQFAANSRQIPRFRPRPNSAAFLTVEFTNDCLTGIAKNGGVEIGMGAAVATAGQELAQARARALAMPRDPSPQERTGWII